MMLHQATDYAFRAIQYLMKHRDESRVEAKQIADSEEVPIRFLLKIMPLLIEAGIVDSQRGVGGGYFLARDPGNITFLDVVEAVEGPVYLNRCHKDYAYCNKHSAPNCAVHQSLKSVQEVLVRELENHTFAELE